jgi:hypothetical protein
MSFTRMEKVEMALLAGAVGTFAAWPGEVIWTEAFGTVVGACAALLLGQGLARDLARLWVNRATSTEKRRIACLCAESTIGLGLIAVALGVTALGIVEPVTLDHSELVLLAAVILGGGFIAKDYVVTVRKETDHGSVIVR